MTIAAPRVAAVVLAGGSGTRLGGDRNKVYLSIGGEPVLSRSVRTMRAVPGVCRLVLVVRLLDRADAARLAGPGTELVEGGSTRHDSEYAAFCHLAPAIRADALDVVLVHDAARPLCPPELARAVVETAATHGGAVPGVVADDLVEVDGTGAVGRRLGADHIRVQTPQAFAAAPLLAAYERAAADGYAGTDTSACVLRYSTVDIRYVAGSVLNLKVTVPGDLPLAERLLAGG